jgi:biopolymer transport protein ExbD
MAASIGEARVEPDLVPLLDLVLQLVMFFMVCVNFVSEQINANVQLPLSASAQEIMAKTVTDLLVINVEVQREDRRENGRLMRYPLNHRLAGQPIRDFKVDADGRRLMRISFANRVDIEFSEGQDGAAVVKAQRELAEYARGIRERESRATGKPVSQIKEVKMPVVIRADHEANYGLVYPLIAKCNQEGFEKVELRALSLGKGRK